MIVIGIDPGTATTGYGIIEHKDNKFTCLDYGVIKTKKDLSDSKRLVVLNDKLSSIIQEYKPSILAIENVYFFKNLKTALPVSQAKGVIMLTAEKNKMAVEEFTPLEIKMTVTGYGRADKEQVQKMIQRILNLKEKPRPNDAADALGAAICAINKHTSLLN